MEDILDQSALTDQAARLVEAAGAAGADTSDAVCVRGTSLSVEVRNGRIEETQRAEGDDFALRVFVGRKSATVATNALAEPAELAERAVAMAKAAPEDAFAGLADKDRLAGEIADLDLLDRTVPEPDDLTASALAAEEAARGVAGVTRSGGASAGWSLGGLVLATSHGFAGAWLGSRFSLSMSAIAGEGTGMERDYEYETRVFRSDLPDPVDIGRRAGERAVRRLAPRKLDTGQVTVVYEPRVAGGLLSHLAGAVSGSAIARKTSFLRDALDSKVFSSGVRMSDDPRRPRGLGSRPFDGEGVAGAALDLVDDGVLTTWLLDSASARELGLTANGRASRRGGQLSPGVTNLTLHGGELAPDDLIGGIDRGFYVTELIGHGVNQVTGDYSRGAAGFAIENGEIGHPVSEVTIASNLRDMFAALVPASDLELHRRINAPTVAVPGMTVAGS